MDVDSDCSEISDNKESLKEGAASDDESHYSGVTNEDLDDVVDEDFDNDNDVGDATDTSALDETDWLEDESVKEEPLSPKEEPLSDASEAYSGAALYDNGSPDIRENGFPDDFPAIKEEQDDDDIIAWLNGTLSEEPNNIKRPKPAPKPTPRPKRVPKIRGPSKIKKIFHCYYCSTKLKMKAYLPMHVLRHLQEGSTEPYLVPDSSGREVHPAYIDGTVWPRLQNKGTQAYKHVVFKGKKMPTFHCYYCAVSFRYKPYLARHVLEHLERGDQKFEVTDSNGKKVHPSMLPKGGAYPMKSKLFDPVDDKPYKCHLCNFATRHPAVLRSHLKRKAEQAARPKKITCYHCGFAVIHKSRMAAHMYRHFPGEYACDLCIYKGRSPFHLKTHMRKHTNEKPYECHVCGERFYQNCLLQKHVMTHTIEKLHCPHCQFFAIRDTALTEHVNSVHFGPKNYRCPRCKYESDKIDYLRSHYKSFHRMRLEAIKCRFCDFVANRTATLKNHEFTHTNPEGYPCDYCAFITKNKNSLRNHRMVHTGEKPYACELCDFKGTSPSAISRHMVVHVTDRPFKCSFCDLTFKTRQCTKGHEDSVHKQGLETFRCDECSYQTLQKHQLKSHKLTHNPEIKPYACNLCDHATNSKSSLKTHMSQIHSREGKHKCKCCNFSTKSLAVLVKHVKACHPEANVYSCNYCSETFRLKPELIEHERIHLGQPIKRKGKRGPNKYIKCRLCDFETSALRKSREHELTHNEGIQCRQCFEIFPSLESLQEHEKDHVIPVKPKNPSRKKCRFCDFTSIHTRRLRLHEWWHIDNDIY